MRQILRPFAQRTLTTAVNINDIAKLAHTTGRLAKVMYMVPTSLFNTVIEKLSQIPTYSMLWKELPLNERQVDYQNYWSFFALFSYRLTSDIHVHFSTDHMYSVHIILLYVSMYLGRLGVGDVT